MSMQVVLMGFIGSGKTSLYNKITDSEELVEAGGFSVTQKVYLKHSAHGRAPFKVLDTPGFGSSINKIDHAAGIIAALTEGEVNRIIIVVKFDRVDTMQKQILQVLSPIYRFRPLITVLVTHWDMQKSDEKQKNMTLIKDRISKYNLTSFIFCSKEDQPKVVCEQILKEMENTDSQIIDLLATEYTTQFDIAEFQETLEIEIQNSKADLDVEYRKRALSIIKFIKNYSSNSTDLSDVLHTLTLEAKTKADETLTKFEEFNKDRFNELVGAGTQQAFMLHVLLKQSMEEQLKNIARFAQEKMQSINQHCFNNIRKCPYCGLIWMKVQGCDQDTYCGAIPNGDEKLGDAAPKKWEVIWNNRNEVVDVKLNEDYKYYQKQLLDQKIKDQREVLKINNYSYTLGKLGCRRIIQWANMKPLNANEMKELVDPGILDYYCQQDNEITKEMKKAQKPFEEQLLKAVEKQKACIIKC